MKFDFNEFLQFVSQESDFLNRKFNIVPGSSEEAFISITKLVEEFGEFANEVLIAKSLARADKLGENSAKLADEFADVIIVACITAKRLGIDVPSALQTKVDIIKSRNCKES